MRNILFVCLGNICRSPAAESVFRHQADSLAHPDTLRVDSAGILGVHAGEPADERMQRTAAARGLTLTSRARQLLPEDFHAFDLVLTMDRDTYHAARALAVEEGEEARVRSLPDWIADPAVEEIPDPYYGGQQGFERVLDLLEEACANLLRELGEDHGGSPAAP
jgi:protein-tyrosine phosphatase